MSELEKRLREMLPLKVIGRHFTHRVVSYNWSSYPSKGDLYFVEELHKLTPVNHYLLAEPLELEDEKVANPFAPGFASGNGAQKPARTGRLKRRI